MANFNKVILMGNLTRDPELKHAQSGLVIVKFGLAVNRKSKDQHGKPKETTCFVDLTAFGKTGEAIEKYLKKGDPLHIEGHLEYSTWEDKNGGGKRSKHTVTVDSFQFIGGGRDVKVATTSAVTVDNKEDF